MLPASRTWMFDKWNAWKPIPLSFIKMWMSVGVYRQATLIFASLLTVWLNELDYSIGESLGTLVLTLLLLQARSIQFQISNMFQIIIWLNPSVIFHFDPQRILINDWLWSKNCIFFLIFCFFLKKKKEYICDKFYT